jgi:hypothetical protein
VRAEVGMPLKQLEKRLAQDLAADPKLPAAGDPKGGRPEKNLANSYVLPTSSTSAARIVAKLKRDAPEIAERLAAGEFKSARSAARAAGFKVDTPPLTLARRAWKRMSPDERAAFLAEAA